MHFSQLTDEREIRALIDWHNANSESVVLDTETTSKNPREAKLVDIQMEGRGPGHVVAFGAEFLPLLKSLKVRQIGQNWIRYDWLVAHLHGVDLRTKNVRDTLLLDHLRDENAPHDLDSWVQAHYGSKYKEEFWAKYPSYLAAPPEARLEYGCQDVIFQRRFYEWITADLSAQGIPESLIEHLHRLARALFDTEVAGLQIDLNYLAEMGGQLKKDIVSTERELRSLGGFHCEALELEAWAKAIEKAYTPTGKKWRTVEKPEFNWNASKQVMTLLYDKLGLPPQTSWDRVNKRKKLTADDDALDKLQHLHPVVNHLRRHRKLSKMHGTFIEGVLEKVVDSRIYPSFNAGGTVTGRISHSEPNVAQMPSKDDEWGDWAKIRGIFVPDQGQVLITCDYSQLEVCIAAHFSLDKNLLKIINEGASKHDITADALSIPRSMAKTLNFAMQYQCGAKKVADLLGCSAQDAQQAWNRYWETYSGEKAVIDECKRKVDSGLPVVNPFGRQRRFRSRYDNPWEKDAAYRQAYSSLIQGTGSEFTSYSLYTLAEWLKATGYGRAWFSVHDEILLQCLPRHADEVRAKTIEVMTGAAKLVDLRVPLSVQCSEPLSRWQK